MKKIKQWGLVVIKYFLKNRKIRVELDKEFSNWEYEVKDSEQLADMVKSELRYAITKKIVEHVTFKIDDKVMNDLIDKIVGELDLKEMLEKEIKERIRQRILGSHY